MTDLREWWLSATARVLAVAALLLPFRAVADRYDDAVSAAFPGFHILERSEIALHEDQTARELYARVKDRPGLTVGDFNADGRPDFAALIRDSTKKTRDEPWEYYDGYLVVCYGLNGGKFDCVMMTPRPKHIHLPFEFFLATVAPGEYTCFGSRTHDTRDPRPRDEKDEQQTLTIKQGAIGYFRTMGNGDVMYVYRSRTRYTLCILSD
jgi:hypothetical protein